jgi:hypothetical protein
LGGATSYGTTLYGTTYTGGASGDGTVFELLLLLTTTALSTSGSPSTYAGSVTFTATVQTNGVTASNATGNYVFLVLP